MISASHNPMEFNGIKFFNGEGYKLSDALEDEIEELIKNEPKPAPKFIIDPTVDDFYQFTRDSFSVENYEYTEFTGKIPVAI